MRLSLPLVFLALVCRAQGPLDYDRSAPLDVRERIVSERDGVLIFEASFASPKGGRAECRIVAPRGSGKLAGMVWQHGGNQDWTWFLPDAVQLARRGTVSVLMTAPGDRSAAHRAPAAANEIDGARAYYAQVAVDARRAFDLLQARGVDPERIGYAGLSFGAMMGGTLAGIDTRFRTFVLMAGVESFGRHWRESAVQARMREKATKEELDRLVSVMAPIEAVGHLGKAKAPILFQAARFDPGVPEIHALDFFRAAGGPKQLRWYDTGHMINSPEAFADRQRWLREHLKLP